MRYLHFLIFVFFIFQPIDGKGEDYSEAIERWLPQQKLQEAFYQYFSTHNLFPYIDLNQGQFNTSFITPVVEDKRDFITFMLGEFDNETKLTKAVFMITRDKYTEEIFVRTLYIMEGICMSPTLFMDIIEFPGFLACYPKALELFGEPDSLVHISNEILEDGRHRQIWTFYTSHEKYAAIVYLQDDEEGGSFFFLPNPNKG